MNVQLNLFKTEPKYLEYYHKYVETRNRPFYFVAWVFKECCGENGYLNPTDDSVKDRIFTKLDMFGYLGNDTMNNIRLHKWAYKHIVNMYWYVNGKEEYMQPVEPFQYIL